MAVDDLKVYRKTEELLYRVYPRLVNYPKSEKFSLCQSIKQNFFELLKYIRKVICVLLRDEKGLKLVKEKVLYKRNGIEYEQPVVEGRDWWLDFEEKWNDMEIVGFEDIQYTEEQLTRLEEVRDINNVSEHILNDYVMEGIIGEGLEILALKKENEELKQVLADLTETMLLGGMVSNDSCC